MFTTFLDLSLMNHVKACRNAVLFIIDFTPMGSLIHTRHWWQVWMANMQDGARSCRRGLGRRVDQGLLASRKPTARALGRPWSCSFTCPPPPPLPPTTIGVRSAAQNSRRHKLMPIYIHVDTQMQHLSMALGTPVLARLT